MTFGYYLIVIIVEDTFRMKDILNIVIPKIRNLSTLKERGCIPFLPRCRQTGGLTYVGSKITGAKSGWGTVENATTLAPLFASTAVLT
jgi:hypothetical protein